MSSAGGVRRARQLLHVSVLAQSAAPCGRFLAAANDFGEIAIFGLSAALSAEAKEENRRPVNVFKAHSGPVYSLASTERLLLSGSDGEIRGWAWAELGRKGCRELWTRRPPCRSSLEVPEINGLEVNQRDHWVALAGGDGAVRVLDLESGAFTHELRGHQDLVHVVALREQLPQVLSGGEDGTVRLWGESADGLPGAADRGAQIPGVQPPPAGQVDPVPGNGERLDGVRGRPRPHAVAPALRDPDHGVPPAPPPAPRPLPPGHGALGGRGPRPSPAAAQRGRAGEGPGVAPRAAEPLPAPPVT